MVGAEHVVDAHINAVFGKRAANAVARGTESVGEAAAYSMVRVGNGRVVEVAHNKDFVPFDAVDKVRQCISLLGTLNARHRKLRQRVRTRLSYRPSPRGGAKCGCRGCGRRSKVAAIQGEH